MTDFSSLTLRCMRCRWLFAVPMTETQPRCPQCGSNEKIHELETRDFEDDTRAANPRFNLGKAAPTVVGYGRFAINAPAVPRHAPPGFDRSR